MLVGRDEAAFCGSSASCPSVLKSVRLFPRRRCVLPALRFPGSRYMCLRDELGADLATTRRSKFRALMAKVA